MYNSSLVEQIENFRQTRSRVITAKPAGWKTHAMGLASRIRRLELKVKNRIQESECKLRNLDAERVQAIGYVLGAIAVSYIP